VRESVDACESAAGQSPSPSKYVSVGGACAWASIRRKRESHMDHEKSNIFTHFADCGSVIYAPAQPVRRECDLQRGSAMGGPLSLSVCVCVCVCLLFLPLFLSLSRDLVVRERRNEGSN